VTGSGDCLYDQALALVHQHKVASAALLERRLGVDQSRADALMAQIARETPEVEQLDSGLYLYLPDSLVGELRALRGLADAVLAAIRAGTIDLAELRDRAVSSGLATHEQLERDDTGQRRTA